MRVYWCGVSAVGRGPVIICRGGVAAADVVDVGIAGNSGGSHFGAGYEAVECTAVFGFSIPVDADSLGAAA